MNNISDYALGGPVSFLNYSIEPDPIQSHQSWVSKFENIRRFEAHERERELRRNETHSNDGLVETLLVVGIIAMIVIPFIIWMYYKSPICDPTKEHETALEYEEQRRRRYKYNPAMRRISFDNDYHPERSMVEVPFSVPLKKSEHGLGCPKPSCVCTTENETKSKKKTYRQMREDAPYAPAKV